MRTTRIKYRRLADTRIMCIALNDDLVADDYASWAPCGHVATWCRQWQTTVMSGPAFWNLCNLHARRNAERDGLDLT